VICGHIHHATQRRIDGLDYINTGDWVESCTAIGERHDGRLEIIRWRDTRMRHANEPEAKRQSSIELAA
jgi:UDP-2,3-diacylglucosamine pyrophosphatase LpxH